MVRPKAPGPMIDDDGGGEENKNKYEKNKENSQACFFFTKNPTILGRNQGLRARNSGEKDQLVF